MLIEEIKADWCESIKRLYLSSKVVSDSIKSMYRTCDSNIKKLSKLSREINKHTMTMPENKEKRDLRKDFEKVYIELCDKGHIGRMFKLFHAECEYIIRELKVDDKSVKSMDQAVIIMLYFEVNDLIKDTATIWNNTMKNYGGPLVEDTLQGIIELEIPLERLMRTLQEENKYIDGEYDIKRAI